MAMSDRSDKSDKSDILPDITQLYTFRLPVPPKLQRRKCRNKKRLDIITQIRELSNQEFSIQLISNREYQLEDAEDHHGV